MTNRKGQTQLRPDMPRLVSMPPAMKAELLAGVPNLLQDPPIIHTRCSECGREESSHRYSGGEDGQLVTIDECLHCGHVKSERILTPQK